MIEGAQLLSLAQGAAGAFVAMLMLRAGVHKLSDTARFGGVLADYDLAPEWALPWIGRFLPLAEIAAAIALVFPPLAAAGAALAGGLLLVYAGAMAAAIVRGRRQIDCGCGGPPLPLNWALVARNAALVAALSPLMGGSPARVEPIAAGGEWAIALVAICVWLGVEQLAANHHRMLAGGDLAARATAWRAA